MHSLTYKYLTALRFDGSKVTTLPALGKQQLYAAHSPEAIKCLDTVVVSSLRLKYQVLQNVTPKSRFKQEIVGYSYSLAPTHKIVREARHV